VNDCGKFWGTHDW